MNSHALQQRKYDKMAQKTASLTINASHNYTYLLRELAITDFRLKYQGSAIGYLWSISKPLAVFGILYTVFTVFLRVGSDIPHYPVYLLLGVVLWSFVSECSTYGMRSIVDKGDLMRKIYFPRIILVIASTISATITLLINLLVVVLFLLIARVFPQPLAIAEFILLLVELYVLCLGLSFLLSSLYTKFRDISHIWEVFLQLLFYASAVIYPLAAVPSKYRTLLTLNPVTQILQDSRYLLVTKNTVTPSHLLHHGLIIVPYIIPFLLLGLGYSLFNRSAAHFAEEV